MKASLLGIVVVGTALTVVAGAQAPSNPPAAAAPYVNAARKAAGQDHPELFNSLCTPPPAPAAEPPRAGKPGSVAPNAPPREKWYAAPAKVFDNLYFLGMTEYTSWAITTSDGIIITDPLFEYAVEDEVVNGLTKLGLDPKNIKYVIVHHAHRDHVGGAALLQSRYKARIVMGGPDWDLVATDPINYAKPKRDIVATEGQRLTLGDTTVTIHLMPGHTLGTLSSVFPVKDGGRTHTAFLWGGTGFNWRASARYISPERPATFWYDIYAKSAARMREIAQRAKADVILSNHPGNIQLTQKQAALAKRGAGQPHPWVVGNDRVVRFVTVAEECAKAGPHWTTPPR